MYEFRKANKKLLFLSIHRQTCTKCQCLNSLCKRLQSTVSAWKIAIFCFVPCKITIIYFFSIEKISIIGYFSRKDCNICNPVHNFTGSMLSDYFIDEIFDLNEHHLLNVIQRLLYHDNKPTIGSLDLVWVDSLPYSLFCLYFL